jgi:hypothetical protein
VLVYASVIWLRAKPGFALYTGSIAVATVGWSEEKGESEVCLFREGLGRMFMEEGRIDGLCLDAVDA